MKEIRFSLFKTFWFLPAVCLALTFILLLTPFRTLEVPYYIAVHTSLEAICIMISIMIFMTQFLLKEHTTSGLYRLLGIPFLGIGLLDFLHTMNFKGLPDLITPNGPQKTISFWLSARVLEAFTFLLFAISVSRAKQLKIKYRWSFLLVLLYVVLITYSVFLAPQIWPDFVDANGHLTWLKRGIEIFLVLIHIFVSYLLTKSKSQDLNYTKNTLLTASLIFMASGICFTVFVETNDVIIFWGHILKTIGYYFIFRAALVFELIQPYENLLKINQEVQVQAEYLRNVQHQLWKTERMSAIGMGVNAVIHDLNNTLMIAGHSAKKISQLLSQPGEVDRIQSYSKTLIRSLDQSHEFQKLLLLQGRSHSATKSSSELTVKDLDLTEILTEFFPLLKVLVAERADLTMDISQLSPKANFRGIKIEFEQVILNLVSNAKDAIHPANYGQVNIGGSTINLDSNLDILGQKLPSGSYYLFTVKDSGTGISKEALPHLFEAFYSTKEKGFGTGLGLSTVKRIVDSWHGYIDVESEIDVGTTFKIYIPKS